MDILKSSEKLKLFFFQNNKKSFENKIMKTSGERKGKKPSSASGWEPNFHLPSLCRVQPSRSPTEAQKNLNPVSLIIFLLAMRKQLAVGASSLGGATIHTTNLPLPGRLQVPHHRAEKP
jgi:hypothetical protein